MANIIVSTTALGINVSETVSNISVTDVESNVIVTNVASSVANVTVSSTDTTVNVSQTASISNASVRTKLGVENVSGYGNLAYDSTDASNGIFQYTGVSNADIITVIDNNPANVTQHLSVVDTGGDGSLSYANATGVFTYTGPSATEVRAHISSADAGGDGSLGYDQNTGVITYQGPDQAEANARIAAAPTQVRAHLSNIAPIEYNATTGVIGLDTEAVFSNTLANSWFTTQTTDNLTEGSANLYYTDARVLARVAPDVESSTIKLKQYSETYYNAGNVSGAVSLDIANGTMQNIRLIANVTNISFANLAVGGSITILATQDSTGNKTLENATSWSNYQWAGNFTDIQPTADKDTTITIFYDGVNYNASVVRFDAHDPLVGLTTDDLPEGSTNLYYTDARFDTRLATKSTSNLTEGTNLYYTDARVETKVANLSSNVTTTANLNAAGFVTTSNATVGANLNVLGNLEVTGNINYREVEDLLVQDQTITLNYGNASAQNAEIIVDRAGSGLANTALKWNETTDKWTFSNDGSTYNNMLTLADIPAQGVTSVNGDTGPAVTLDTDDITEGTAKYYATSLFNTDFATKTTTDLTEGTNLYFTNARADARVNLQTGTNLDLSSKSTSDLTEGTNLYYTDGRSRAAVSTTTASASSGGSLAYDSGTGVFTFAPAVPGIQLSALSTTTAAASGGGALSYNNATGVFTFTPADVSSSYGNVEVADFLANGFGSNTITTTGDITTTGFFEGDLNGAVTVDVYNNTGGTLNKGDAVYLTGGNNGDNPHVALADADDATKMPALGIVRENINDASVGQVVTSGEMNDSSHGYTLGADLYIDTIAGGLTTTKPTGEDKLIQKIGKVVSANHILIQGAFRTNATPNLNEGNIFLGSSSDTAITVTPDSNFETTGNAFSLSTALTDVNSITTDSTSGFAINSSDGTTVTSPFGEANTVTETANISGKGYGIFNMTNSSDTTITYTGGDLDWFEIDGSTTAGSTTLTISAIQGGSATFTVGSLVTGTSYIIVATGTTDFTAIGSADNNPGTVFTATGPGTGTGTVKENITATVADLNIGQVFENGSLVLFPGDAYITAIQSGSGTVTMSQPAINSAIFTYASHATILDAGLVDTTTGLVITLYSDARNGGGSTSALSQRIIKNYPFGYPATGPEADDFDIITAGTASDYAVGSYSAYTMAQTPITDSKTALNAPMGITIGENTQLTNRGENDQFRSFGMNMLYDGKQTIAPGAAIQPQVLFKSYTDQTVYSSQPGSSGPRLFFSSALGNVDSNPYTTYPRTNQELGRLSFWGSTGTLLNPSSYNVPAYMSVHAADDWATWNGGGPGGNTNVYMGATSNGSQTDTYLAYKAGELLLGAANSKPVTLAPAYGQAGSTPEQAYSGNFTTWANVNYASGTTGAKLQVTNGGSSGVGVVGDMELSVHRNDVSNGGSNSSVQNGFTLGSNFYNNLQLGGFPDKSAIVIGNYNGSAVDLTGLSSGDQVTFDNYTGALGTEINGNSYYVLVRPWGYAGSFPGVPFYAQYLIALYTDATYTTPLQLSTASGAYGSSGTMEWTVAPSVTDREFKFQLPEQSDNLILKNNNADVVFFNDKLNIGDSSNASINYSLPSTAGTTNQILKLDTNNDLQWADESSLSDAQFLSLLRKYIGTINFVDGGLGNIDGGLASTTTFAINIDGGNA